MLRRNLSGFTLVELIIYITLFSLTTTALVSMSLLVSGVSAKSLAAQAVLMDARQIDGFIRNKLLLTENVVNPTAGVSFNSLEISFYSGETGRIYLENGQVKYTEAGNIYNISSSDTIVSSLEFINLGINKDSIKYSFNIDKI